MTLVERFIDFRDWPISRKSAFAGALLLPALLFGAVAAQIIQSSEADASLVAILLWIGFIVALANTVVSWTAYRRGKAGRWTAYAFILSYQLWMVVFTLALGGMTTSVLALPASLPLFTMIWYDVRLGTVSAGYIGTGLVAGGILNVTGVLPFAPAMEVRNIDDLNNFAWFGVILLVLSIAVGWVYLVAFVATAAAELQSRRLTETHTRLERAHGLIRRYVPEQVAEAVLSNSPEVIGQHERRKLTIFFSDLVGFTDLSDELEPEDLAMVLHDYFTEMSVIARKHAGTVDDLVGDAILVLFGAPEASDDHDQALRAVRMAVEMQEAMGPLNERWERAGIPEALQVRMGVNTGVATVGNFGSAERTKYTALGKQVNIAARIQSQCKPGRVLLGHPTWLLVRAEVPCTPVGELVLKGLRKPMPAHEVDGLTHLRSETDNLSRLSESNRRPFHYE